MLGNKEETEGVCSQEIGHPQCASAYSSQGLEVPYPRPSLVCPVEEQACQRWTGQVQL